MRFPSLLSIVSVATLAGLFGLAVSPLFSELEAAAQDDRNRISPDLCNFAISPPGDERATYTWLLAMQGVQRDGGEVALNEGIEVTCETLGIEPRELKAARWLYIIRSANSGYEWLRLQPTGPACNADIDGDGVVGVPDLGQTMIQYFWVCTKFPCSADFSGDGVVNPIDLGLLRTVYLQTCGAPAPHT
jgi:hypothetical protein